MLDITTSTEGDNVAPVLAGAILLYESNHHTGSKNTGMATIHAVDSINGRPEIMPGRLVTNSDLVILVKDLAKSKGALETQWLDPGILAKGPDRMIWWTPPQKRPMFFKASSYNEKTFDGHAHCPAPGMVWMSMPGQGLFVYAVPGNLRPAPDTQLYQAPLFNVWGRGKVCVGSAKLPNEGEHGSALAWEAVIFGSHFTHPNFTEKDRLIKGVGPVEFWKRMVKKPTNAFPDKKLVQLPLVVGDLLDRLLLDRLNKLPKPKGEF